MLRQEDLAFIKTISTLPLSPALLRELRMALPDGRRSRWCLPGAAAPYLEVGPEPPPPHPQRPSAQLTRKRKANELAISDESFEPAKRRLTPSERSARVPVSVSAQTRANNLLPAADNLERPRGGGWGAIYVAVLAGTVVPFQPDGSFNPTAMGSDTYEPAVSSETAKRRMSSDMSGPLNERPDGTTPNVQVTNTFLPAGECPNKTLIFISGFRDGRTSLAWLRASCPGGLTAQLTSKFCVLIFLVFDSQMLHTCSAQ